MCGPSFEDPMLREICRACRRTFCCDALLRFGCAPPQNLRSANSDPPSRGGWDYRFVGDRYPAHYVDGVENDAVLAGNPLTSPNPFPASRAGMNVQTAIQMSKRLAAQRAISVGHREAGI